VRPLRRSDLPEVLAIEAASNPHPWHEGDFLPFVAASGEEGSAANGRRPEGPRAGALRRAWAVPGPDGSGVRGFACIAAMADEVELQSLAVLPEARRTGIGSALLECLIEWAREGGFRALHLEVRAGNLPAIALYRRFGFAQTGRRRGYYQDNGEDALLLTRDFANLNRSTP
jgi:ribosomal-protein-alanine acetyltransferase